MSKTTFSYPLIVIMVMISCTQFVNAQQERKLVGRVLTENGSPIANVQVENLSQKGGGFTEKNGHFKIVVKEGDTIQLTSHAFLQCNYVVPKMENPLLFEDIVLKWDRELMLKNYRNHTEEKSVVHMARPTGKIKLIGQVTNTIGHKLVGVNVNIAHTIQGTTTDDGGVYEMWVDEGDTIQYSFVGHAVQKFVVESEGENALVYNVMLVEGVNMLDDFTVEGKEFKFDYSYERAGTDVEEIGKYTIRQQAAMTDKTRIPTFGLSTARYGGIASIFKKLKGTGSKRKDEEMSDRQQIMRQKVLEQMQKADSTQVNEVMVNPEM